MSSVLNNNNSSAQYVNDKSIDTGLQRRDLYKLLKEHEQHWWQARQQLIERKERKIFWHGENSLIMWLVWQLVGYVVLGMALMVMNNLLGISLVTWQYVAFFVLLTVFFAIAFALKGRFASKLQRKIDDHELVREQTFNEMVVLAEDSLYPDVHAKSPISLEQLHKHINGQLHLVSLQRLLQKEVDAGRLALSNLPFEMDILPPDLANAELGEHADKIIYKSTL